MATLYEIVGGDQWFQDLCSRFYDRVEKDPVLRPLYPADPQEFEASRDWLAQFLIQFWGGSGAYSEARGHPRLRMRHMHFQLGRQERDLWFEYMSEALAEGGLTPEVEAEVLGYFENAATQMINVEE